MNKIHGEASGSPVVMTRKESHDKVMHLFKSRNPGRVLDIPCGQGALALRLREAGFGVSCCDIDAGLFRFGDLPFMQGNLNQKLPYDDASFEYVASIAGIHRVHRFQFAISEFSRILVPGGELILSFPNYSNIERRLKFLFTGSVSKVVNVMGIHEHHTEDPDAHFRQLLLFPQVYFSLEKSGFIVTGLTGDKLKYKSLVLLPLWLVIKMLQGVSSKETRKKLCLKWMSSFEMLFGANNLIVSARKTVTRSQFRGGRNPSKPSS